MTDDLIGLSTEQRARIDAMTADRVTELTLRCGDLRHQRDRALSTCVDLRAQRDEARAERDRAFAMMADEAKVSLRARVEAVVAPWPPGVRKGDVYRAIDGSDS